MGVLKPFKLLKCILAGGKKGKLFCNFFYCKCACLCAIACYNLREPCFMLSGGCRKCVKPRNIFTRASCNFTKASYNFTGVSYNFTGVSYNFTIGRCNFTGARNNFYNGRYNFTGARNNFADERYKTTDGYYIKHGGYYTFLLSVRKCQAANCFVLGTCRTENRLDIRFNVYRSVNKACTSFIKHVISGNAGIY